MKVVLLLALLTVFSFPTTIKGAIFVGYFPNWSRYRPAPGTFTEANIDTSLCTHYIYAFAVLDGASLTIKAFDPEADITLKGYANFVALKAKNPALKMMIGLGGWNDSHDPNYPRKYSQLVSSSANINNFVTSVVSFIRQHGFDGLDLDWEYPSGAADKTGFTSLIIALKTAFQPNGWLLSAAVSAGSFNIDAGYDAVAMNQYLDFVNLMAYDYHGASWEPSSADHHSPLLKRSTDPTNFNADYSVNYWINKGLSASKIVLGMPLYGMSWRLSSSTITPPAPASGEGLTGIAETPGMLTYYEICNYILKSGWTAYQDSTKSIGPYAVSPTSPKIWVGYDDPAMATVKTNYLISKGLAGAMVWDVSMDDFGNICGTGNNPVMSAIANTLKGVAPNPTTTTSSPVSTTTVPSTTTISTTTNPSTFVCPTPTGLYADPASCTNYYNCGNGIAYKYACAAGLYFNDKMKYCDWPANVVCSITSTTAATTTTVAPTSTTTKSSSTFVCPSLNGLFADPASCTNYYNCGWGTPYKMACSAGLYFNDKMKYCDWPANVVCTISG